MTSPARQIPTNYGDLVAAITNGVFPHERHWLDFKEMLYQPQQAGRRPPKSRDDVHEELARDLASLAIRGGFLVYGVHEDKQNHIFTVVEMDLPTQLDQTIDQVARARITPALYVIPTLVPNPASPGRGLLVVEVPESAMAPHMVGGVYYGRSETGKMPLPDDEVERLIARRGQAESRLRDAMRATLEAADPIAQWPDRVSHLYLTALPTQPWPEMFLSYTRDRTARGTFIVQSANIVNAMRALDADRPGDIELALAGLIDHQRSQRTHGAWFYTWPQGGEHFPGTERVIGIGDDGAVRYMDLNAGSRPEGDHRYQAAARMRGAPVILLAGRAVLYDVALWWRTLDVLRLISHLAAESKYRGSWLIGIEIDQLRGRVSNSMHGPAAGYDDDAYSNDTRATTDQLTQRPRLVTGRLLQPLFRDLGTEPILPTTT
jgi:hypothetical protein